MGGGIGSIYHSARGVAFMCASLILGLGISFIAIALAVGSSLPFAVGGAIALPFLFFLFVVGLAVARHDHAVWAAYVFAAIGLLFGLNALRGIAQMIILGYHPTPAPAHELAAAGARREGHSAGRGRTLSFRLLQSPQETGRCSARGRRVLSRRLSRPPSCIPSPALQRGRLRAAGVSCASAGETDRILLPQRSCSVLGDSVAPKDGRVRGNWSDHASSRSRGSDGPESGSPLRRPP